MSKNKPVIFPVPVIVSTINNSQSGKYVVVEGSDDIVVYRNLITIYKSKGINVIAAGGKDKVLEVFDNLKNTSNLAKAIFIVDQDSWIFTGIPPQYQHPRIIYTSGYSIENDIYVDKNLDLLMQGVGVYTSFQTKLAQYLEWFALAINRYCTNNNANSVKLDIHPDNFFRNVNLYCALQSGEAHPNSTYNDLMINYALKFRGKCLMPLAIGELNSRHNSPSYNSKTIMEDTAITGRGVHLNRIFSEVERLA
ncbi:DUF4435 domain-containing protein [Acinetobacter brisouii]|uniref:DUF4435 domain-containing protein n=1 Tax=Acinetobacter brisouii TaxID=396323 RepID=UPI00148F175F|nr:DUF4435 domain-containing protein [Acinetobacter brisouii]